MVTMSFEQILNLGWQRVFSWFVNGLNIAVKWLVVYSWIVISLEVVNRDFPKQFSVREMSEPWFWLCLLLFSTVINNISWPWQDNYPSSWSCSDFFSCTPNKKWADVKDIEQGCTLGVNFQFYFPWIVKGSTYFPWSCTPTPPFHPLNCSFACMTSSHGL